MSKSLSIVTVTLNSERFLRDTIESVANQTSPPSEFILIDGGSTDNTMGIVYEYRDLFTKIVSEPDHGIADAMNKGIHYCTGEFILFLHSDDYLAQETSISNALKLLDDQHDIFSFDIIMDRGDALERQRPDAFTFRINFKTTFYHQAVICRRSLFEKIGEFDTGLSVEMDYDLFLRAYRSNARVKKCHELLSVMRDTGVSSKRDWQSLQFRFGEEKAIHEKNCESTSMRLVYMIYWVLYPAYRRLKLITE